MQPESNGHKAFYAVAHHAKGDHRAVKTLFMRATRQNSDTPDAIQDDTSSDRREAFHYCAPAPLDQPFRLHPLYFFARLVKAHQLAGGLRASPPRLSRNSNAAPADISSSLPAAFRN